MAAKKIAVGVVVLTLLLGSAGAGEKMHIEVVETSAMITLGSATFITVFANVILPDGSHAKLICGDRASDNHCAKIEEVSPEKMPVDSTKCSTLGRQTTCVTTNLGRYEAERRGNELTIRAPNGKLKFRIIGSW
jgi:hypothetical protein